MTGLGSFAQAQPAPPILPTLSFGQALSAVHSQSPQLAASHKAVESAQLRREGMQGLGGPSVAITGMAYRYSANADVNLDSARNALGNVLGQLPAQVVGSVGQLPQLPSNYPLQRQNSNASASVLALWPMCKKSLSHPICVSCMTDKHC